MQLTDNSIKILQWNVHNTTPQQAISEHLNIIRDSYGPPDITCLQEVIADPASNNSRYAVNHQFRDRPLLLSKMLLAKSEGIVTSSSYELASYDETILSQDDPIMRLASLTTRRMCQQSSYYVSNWGEEIHTAHAHLSPVIPVANRQQRIAERHNLIEIVKSRIGLGRFVLLGDFNVTTSSRLVKELQDAGLVCVTEGAATLSVRIAGAVVRRVGVDHVFVSKDLHGYS